MITVEMELRSAIHESRDRNLCRIEIANDGTGSARRGDYVVRLFARGNGRMIRTARVTGYPRESLAAWNLLTAAMKALSHPSREYEWESDE